MQGWARSRKGYVIAIQWLVILVVAVYGATTEAGRTYPIYFWGMVGLASILVVALMRLPVSYFYRPVNWMQIFVVDTVFVGGAIYFIRGFDADLYLPYFLIILTASISRTIARGVLVALGITAAYYLLIWRSGQATLLDTGVLIRIPFLFVVALFTSYLAHGARVQQEVMEESKLLSDQIRSLQGLAAGVSHEVRNPLTALNNVLGALAPRLAQGSEERKLVEESLEQVRRVTRIMEETLDVARPANLQLRWMDLRTVLDRAAEESTHGLPEGKVAIEQRAEIAYLPINGDGALLGQMFSNLLRNAIEAMNGGGIIRIETGTRIERGREEVVVRILDNGPGIPPHQADRLFQPFYTTKPGGTGLGLVLSRKCARAHGGDLEVAPRPGGGTAITVSLPVSGPAPAAAGEG